MPLFSFETDRVRLAWHGAPAPEDPTRGGGGVQVQALRGGGVEVEGGGEGVWLGEQTPYRVFVRSLTGGRVALRHEDPNLLAGLATDDGGGVLSGPLDFRGEVGASQFVVEVEGEPEAAFTVSVAPTKATAEEVEAMRTDLDETLAGLALEYLRAARVPARPTTDFTGRASWLTLLRRAIPDLEAALAAIARQPHRDLRREPAWQRAERVRRPDTAVRRALRRGDAGERLALPVRAAEPTLDTPEHRWLRVRLAAARRTLADLDRAERALPLTRRRARTLADLADAEQRLSRLLRLEPLQAASAEAPPAPTARLLTAPGYAEAYAAARTLSLGLTLAEGPLPHATKDLPALYEAWAYLATARELAALLGCPLPPEAFFRGDHYGVRMLLRRGRAHAVRLRGEGMRATLAYNPRLGGRLGLLAQRPDLLLILEREGRPPRWLILDAKYRRDDSAAYVRRYGAPGPPEDALGDLHRYRDAVVTGAASPRRVVESAAAVYPYSADDAFAETRLWASVERIGVGAVPLLPGHTRWLRRWLEAALVGQGGGPSEERGGEQAQGGG